MSVLNSPHALDYLKEVRPDFVKIVESTNKRCFCGERLSQHKKCANCGVLVGEGHETKILEGRLCWSCKKYEKGDNYAKCL